MDPNNPAISKKRSVWAARSLQTVSALV